MNTIKTIYEALPDDVKRKVSLHDLKRIADALAFDPVDKQRLDWLEVHWNEFEGLVCNGSGTIRGIIDQELNNLSGSRPPEEIDEGTVDTPGLPDTVTPF